MTIATRITLTTSVLVVLALAVYGYVQRGDEQADVAEARSREARQLAAALRAGIETDPKSFMTIDLAARGEQISRELARAGLPWKVALLDVRTLPPADPELPDDPRRARLRKLVQIGTAIVEEDARVGNQRAYVYLEPVRVPHPSVDGYRIVGAIELTRPHGADAGGGAQRWVSLAVIALLSVVAVYFTSSRGIGRPIRKLIAGIDDVTRGDLSHVVLQEREDELGALATRFNEMTGSLREAREETRRGAETRAELELRLRSSEKMATVGSIAAEIAHEVGTPLNVVTGRARAMARKADDPEAVQKNASIIAEQAERITRIIQRLLDFARRRVGEAESPVDIDLGKLASDTIEFLEHQLEGHRVEARMVREPDVGMVVGNKDQIQQVLINLCMNAIQAMPSGGQLSMRLGRVVRRRPGLELAPEQPYAVLEVADTGVGIPAEDRDKIFEPFYTSKSASGGSGLGLAVTHGIVKDHDGWMEVLDHQAAGRGTIFKVFLPMAG